MIKTIVQIFKSYATSSDMYTIAQVTYLPVKSDGLIDMAQLEAAIRPDTALVSVMHVNNEIGVVLEIFCISAFYCD